VEGSCEHGNELSASIICWEILGHSRANGYFSRWAQIHGVCLLENVLMLKHYFTCTE
jgi:hypothetical protein